MKTVQTLASAALALTLAFGFAAEASAHACTAPEPRRYIYSDAYTNTYFHTNTDAYTDSDSLPGSRLYFEHLQLQCFGRRYLR